MLLIFFRKNKISTFSFLFFRPVNNKLWYASQHGDIDLMKMALHDGAQVEHRQEFSFGPSTCLHVAVSNGHLNATKLLLKEGANVNAATGKYQYTPMMIASWQNKPDILKLLLEHNGKTNLKNYQGSTAIHSAARKGHLSIVQLLVGKSNVNERDNNGKAPLCLAEENKWSNSDYDAVILCLTQNGATM